MSSLLAVEPVHGVHGVSEMNGFDGLGSRGEGGNGVYRHEERSGRDATRSRFALERTF